MNTSPFGSISAACWLHCHSKLPIGLKKYPRYSVLQFVLSDDFSSGTVEDYIVEIDRKTGNIVKEIDLKDILKMTEGKSENRTN